MAATLAAPGSGGHLDTPLQAFLARTFFPTYFVETYYRTRWRLTSCCRRRVPIIGKYAPAVTGLLPTFGGFMYFIYMIFIVSVLTSSRTNDVEESGDAAAVFLALSFIFSTRNNPVTVLFGVPFERVLWWHRGVTWLSLSLGLAHGLQAVYGPISNGKWLFDGGVAFIEGREGVEGAAGDHDDDDDSPEGSIWSGLAMTICMGVLCLTSLGPIRRNLFELFVRMHWLTIIVLLLFGAIHGGLHMLIAFWAVDLIIRVVSVCGYGRLEMEASVSDAAEGARDNHSRQKKPERIVHLIMPKTFEYKPGQYVFLCVPSLSRVEWHPFSICSAPHEEGISVFVRVLGDWTGRLSESVASGCASGCAAGTSVVRQGGETIGAASGSGMARESDPDPASPATIVSKTRTFTCLVEGPYGALSVDLKEPYSRTLFVCGGIGATPLLSVLKDLLHSWSAKQLETVTFLWSVRDWATVATLLRDSQILTAVVGDEHTRKLDMRIHATRPIEKDNLLYERSDAQQTVPSNLQQLRMNVRDGRPDLNHVFEKLAQAGGRVAVLSCGPATMIRECQRCVVESSRKGVRFDLHTERFDW
eukprot:TRINITY_DN6153_c0_g1_i1.p1 TRINITY_DN6153_c0_g1~~TRINITY_DN6153_c0_g1_i1.p1  ORF type:complete len:586 (-),score=38.63 TRINITY_DN6153_c0_g1_i1:340-2097(-)